MATTAEIIANATKVAEAAAKEIGGTYDPNVKGGFVPGANYKPPTINSGMLTQQPANNYSAPPKSSPYPVAGLNPPSTALSSQEQEVQKLIDQTKGYNTQLAGQSAYQTEQEKLFGIPDLQKTQDDLTQQLQTIQNEAAAIPLQLQQGAADRGVTLPVLGKQENARLRTNAIAALGVSTLLSASQGNLADAQYKVTQAMEQKYGPIKGSIQANMDNLNLIMKSPNYTKDQQAQAEAQYQAQKANLASVDNQESEAKQIWDIATDAAAKGQNFKPTFEYPTLAAALKAISEAPSKEAALQIQSATGLSSPSTQVSLSQLNTALNGLAKISKNLAPGMTGSDVLALQTYLKAQGYAVNPTGTYDAATTAAVLELQKKLGVDYSSGPGYFGPKTKAALGLQPASSSSSKSSSSSSSGIGYSAATKSNQQKANNWIMVQPGYTQKDLQKLKDDPAFFAWVLSQS